MIMRFIHFFIQKTGPIALQFRVIQILAMMCSNMSLIQFKDHKHEGLLSAD